MARCTLLGRRWGRLTLAGHRCRSFDGRSLRDLTRRTLVTRTEKGQGGDQHGRGRQRRQAQRAPAPLGGGDACPQTSAERGPVRGAGVRRILRLEQGQRPADVFLLRRADRTGAHVAVELPAGFRFHLPGEHLRGPVARFPTARRRHASPSCAPAAGARRALRFRTAWKKVALAVPIDMPAAWAISVNFIPSYTLRTRTCRWRRGSPPTARRTCCLRAVSGPFASCRGSGTASRGTDGVRPRRAPSA